MLSAGRCGIPRNIRQVWKSHLQELLVPIHTVLGGCAKKATLHPGKPLTDGRNFPLHRVDRVTVSANAALDKQACTERFRAPEPIHVRHQLAAFSQRSREEGGLHSPQHQLDTIKKLTQLLLVGHRKLSLLFLQCVKGGMQRNVKHSHALLGRFLVNGGVIVRQHIQRRTWAIKVPMRRATPTTGTSVTSSTESAALAKARGPTVVAADGSRSQLDASKTRRSPLGPSHLYSAPPVAPLSVSRPY